MTVLQVIALVLVASAGTATVLIRDPLRQSICVSVGGMFLAVLFFVVQAPDVALSEVAVCSILIPGLLLVALGRMRPGAGA